jgi:hypothetical protein
MLDHLKKDRQVGFGAQERVRLALYVAALLALGGFIVISATGHSKPARAPEEPDPAAAKAEPVAVLDPATLNALVVASGAEPERFSPAGIEYLRTFALEGRWGDVQERLAPRALAARDPTGMRGRVFEVVGRVVDVSRETYRPPGESRDQRLWSVVLEGPEGGTMVALEHSLASEQDEGPPADTKPPLVSRDRIAVGQQVIVRGVYLQRRTGTIGQIVLREPTPVLFSSAFRIEFPLAERRPPISSIADALWSDIEDRLNRQSRRWDEDALFEVVQWARTQGPEACRRAVLEGEIEWQRWERARFETWKKEVPTTEGERPFTDNARGSVFRVSGIIGEVLKFGWERVTRNAWGVDEIHAISLLSDHYRNVALRLILPFPISDYPGVAGERAEHVRVYGVYLKNYTYDTRHQRPDGSERNQPITVPMFVVLHMEPFPIEDAGRGMRTLMYWIAGAMVLFGLLFYLVLIRGGQKQAERMEAHRWALRKRARASLTGKPGQAPPAGEAGGDD